MLKADRVLSTRSHCVKSVGIRSYPGPYFTIFGLNTERYGVYLRIQSECGKMQTRITPNADTFDAVLMTLVRSMLISFRKSKFCKIHRKILCQSLFFNEVAALKPAILLIL